MRHPITGDYTPPYTQFGGRDYSPSIYRRPRSHYVAAVAATVALLGVVLLGRDIVNTKPEGTAREQQFAGDVFNGKGASFYQQVVILDADRNEPINLHTTPLASDHYKPDSSKSNRKGRLLSSLAIVNPIVVDDNILLNFSHHPIHSRSDLEADSTWVSYKLKDQPRIDGRAHAVILCLEGVRPWIKQEAQLDRNAGEFRLASGEKVGDFTLGDPAQLETYFNERGYTKQACDQ